MTVAADGIGVADARMGLSALNPAYPRSWWTIAWSSDVGVGKVVPAKILERDIVLWRDSSGTLHAMAAHCPHLGAHLGTGGTVVNDELQCPFHGWRYATDGRLAGVSGPGKARKDVCIPRYQIIERYGAVFLWNGADEPDIDFPDVLDEVGLTEDEVAFCKHRWYLPYPAKHFAENNPDGSHFAITHDTGGWAETVILEDSPTVLRVNHRIHDAPSWWTWQNLRRRARNRELSNFFGPITGGMTNHCYGATFFVIHLTGRRKTMGSMYLCMTPVDERSFCIMEMMVMPRVRIPLIGPLIQRGVDFGFGALSWTSARQDIPLMMRRDEPANPPYAASDKALIAFRRMWDSRIDTDTLLEGSSVRHNGLRLGIRQPRKESEGRPDPVRHAEKPVETYARPTSVEVSQ